MRAVIVNRRCPSTCVDGYGTDDFYTQRSENASPHDHRAIGDRGHGSTHTQPEQITHDVDSSILRGWACARPPRPGLVGVGLRCALARDGRRAA
eukprot:1118880-Prymnesium_polylepis.2